ncbi:MAG: hypothetical protein GF313_16665 [Caldithrix sp.]|nr:hypothetical protein [Caldithrix sp.]
MKKIYVFLTVLSLFVLLACQAEKPSAPKLDITANQLVPSKMVAIGNSLTAGFQSSGLKEAFQMKSFPLRIAQQMGRGDNFQQPLIDEPGIGNPAGKTPQYLTANGDIVQDDLMTDPAALLLNVNLPRPYDNLGVPGADANDVLNTIDSTGNGNGFFNIVLRNPNFGNTTQLQQAIMLQPSLVLLWIGNNDVLGAALSGTAITGVTITPQNDFESTYTEIIETLQSQTRAQIMIANIPYVTDIPFVNTIPPVVIDPNTGQPVTDDQGNPIPLITEESGVQYVLLTANELMATGTGIPQTLGGNGQPLPATVTLTATEVTTIKDAIDGFNGFLATLAQNKKLVMVDINSLMTDVNNGNVAGVTGKFVNLDAATTAFSLDGVHPNDAGYAVVANGFIETMNRAFGLTVPTVDYTAETGQYTGGAQAKLAADNAVKGVVDLFVN